MELWVTTPVSNTYSKLAIPIFLTVLLLVLWRSGEVEKFGTCFDFFGVRVCCEGVWIIWW